MKTFGNIPVDEVYVTTFPLKSFFLCFSVLFAVMTRWARANNVHKHKPAEATPWSQLRTRRPPGAGGGDGGSSSTAGVKGVAERNPLRKTQPSGSAIKKPNGKKKQYVSEDVNGFLEYLQQTGQHLAKKSQEGEHELREEVQNALKKDKKREDRRIKRQTNKKNKMVSCWKSETFSQLRLLETPNMFTVVK